MGLNKTVDEVVLEAGASIVKSAGNPLSQRQGKDCCGIEEWFVVLGQGVGAA